MKKIFRVKEDTTRVVGGDTRDVRVGPKMGQIGLKWDKSRTLRPVSQQEKMY